MEYQELLNLITFWGYPLMFLLMVVEGPVASLAGSFLASLGIFNIFIVLGLSILGDVLGDVLFYLAGYFGGIPALKKMEKLFRVKQSTLKEIEKAFAKNGAKIIFSVKTTTGLCAITFILAGISKMSFKKFLFYSIMGGVIWSCFIVFLGYFFGHMAQEVDQYIQYTGWIIFALAIALLFSIILIKSNRLKKRNK
jgi:membrane protein DedA with SNARE-associated domain